MKDKIIFKDYLERNFKKAEKEEVHKYLEHSTGDKSLETMISNKSLEETVKIIENEFKIASNKFKVPVKDIRIIKCSNSTGYGYGYYGTHMAVVRLETDKEMLERVTKETEYEVDELRRKKRQKSQEKVNKKKQIKKLKAELNKLEES